GRRSALRTKITKPRRILRARICRGRNGALFVSPIHRTDSNDAADNPRGPRDFLGISGRPQRLTHNSPSSFPYPYIPTSCLLIPYPAKDRQARHAGMATLSAPNSAASFLANL